MNRAVKRSLTSYLLEILVYGVFLAAYCFLVFHFLAERLDDLFHRERKIYAFLSLGLIVAQGFFLERITELLFERIKKARE